MAVYTRRVQAVLSEEQFAALADLAEDTGKPVSVLVREAVERTYFAEAARARGRAALRAIVSLGAPTAEWAQMEDEITRGGTEGADEAGMAV